MFSENRNTAIKSKNKKRGERCSRLERRINKPVKRLPVFMALELHQFPTDLGCEGEICENRAGFKFKGL